MEALKKYWWLLLLLPIGIYIIYVANRAKEEVNDSLQKARDAKAAKALLKALLKTETETESAGISQ